MNKALAALEEDALRLPESERGRLAYELLQSLDAASANPDVLDTVKRRAAELEAGQVQAIPAEEVFRKGRALLK